MSALSLALQELELAPSIDRELAPYTDPGSRHCPVARYLQAAGIADAVVGLHHAYTRVGSEVRGEPLPLRVQRWVATYDHRRKP
jgi:hypothetical protein